MDPGLRICIPSRCKFDEIGDITKEIDVCIVQGELYKHCHVYSSSQLLSLRSCVSMTAVSTLKDHSSMYPPPAYEVPVCPRYAEFDSLLEE